jgi:hypothetical protein
MDLGGIREDVADDGRVTDRRRLFGWRTLDGARGEGYSEERKGRRSNQSACSG